MSSNQECDVLMMLGDLLFTDCIDDDSFCGLTAKFHDQTDASKELAFLFKKGSIDPPTYCQLTRGFRASFACVPCAEQTADDPKAGGSVESSVAKKAKERREQLDIPYDATDAECEAAEAAAQNKDAWCTVAAKKCSKSKAGGKKAGGQNAGGQKAGGQNAGGQKAGGQKDTSKEQNNPLYKTDLCYFTKSGCNNPDCQFAHSWEEVRPHPKLIAAQKHPLYRTEMCMNGENCKIWWYCQFAHDPDELRERVYPDT